MSKVREWKEAKAEFAELVSLVDKWAEDSAKQVRSGCGETPIGRRQLGDTILAVVVLSQFTAGVAVDKEGNEGDEDTEWAVSLAPDKAWGLQLSQIQKAVLYLKGVTFDEVYSIVEGLLPD